MSTSALQSDLFDEDEGPRRVRRSEIPSFVLSETAIERLPLFVTVHVSDCNMLFSDGDVPSENINVEASVCTINSNDIRSEIRQDHCDFHRLAKNRSNKELRSAYCLRMDLELVLRAVRSRR